MPYNCNPDLTSTLSKPRIMVVGDYVWPWYQEACARALEELGCSVIRLGWFGDFSRWVAGHFEPVYHSQWHRIQYRFGWGPTIWRVARRMLQVAEQEQPDIVLFYNVTILSPGTVRQLRRLLPNAVLCQYSNDNPFSPLAIPGLWRHYVRSIPFFDAHFTYRYSNIADYYRLGAHRVELLRSYFIPEDDYPVPEEEIPDRFKCDVMFAGHYEDDGRIEYLDAICRAGFKLNLFGSGWQGALGKLGTDSPLRSQYPISPVFGADYRYAVCGAKVALCFLSKLNCDTYTRRSFQIPAMRVAMLSEYTDDMADLFRPNLDACYFRTRAEMLEQLRRLLRDANLRNGIAASGYNRVYANNHSVVGRMETWLNQVTKMIR